MKWSLFALCIGFCIDLLIGDPRSDISSHCWNGCSAAFFRRRPAASGPPEPVSGS